MPARAMPVITALWWGPTQAWAGNVYETPGQWLHWLSSGTPAWTIVRRSGRKTPSTVQCFRTREDPAPVDRGAVRAAAWLVAVENLEAAQHPGAFLAAGAEGPASGDPISTLDGHGPP